MVYESPVVDDARIDVARLMSAIVRRLPRIIIVTLLLLAATFVVLMFVPRTYEATASLLVEPRESASGRTGGDALLNIFATNPAGVVANQIQLIKSRDTLLRVIEELDLRSVPEFSDTGSGFGLGALIPQAGRPAQSAANIDETVMEALSKRLSVSQQPNSAVIHVTVTSLNPELAAEIANAVARAHVARRAGLTLEDTAETSGWLLEEIDRLRTSVNEAERAVADFKVANDLYVGQGNTNLLDQRLTTISGQISSAQERKGNAEKRAALIRDVIGRGQPVESLVDIQASPVIQQLTQEKARLQSELAQRSATLLASHPTMRALNSQYGELNAQVRAEAQRIAGALEAEAQIYSEQEEALRAEFEAAKSTASAATIDTVTLDGLEREAKSQRDLLEAYLLRYNASSSRVDIASELPDVRVVTMAVASSTPASPKTSLIMIAVAFVSIFLQLAIAIFGELVSGRSVISASRTTAQPIAAEPVAEPAVAVPVSVARVAAANADDDEVEVAEDTIAFQAEEPQSAPAEAQMATVQEMLTTLLAEGETDASPVKTAIRDAERAAAKGEIDSAPATLIGRHTGLVRYEDLVADLVLGRTNLLLLADHGNETGSEYMAEVLIEDAISKGLSVALVDAGSGKISSHVGLTDLSMGDARFGDVVQKSPDNSFAEISWGKGRELDRGSPRPLTLVEALSDIYEVVVVLTGRINTKSMLADFAQLGGRIVVVAGRNSDLPGALEARQRLMDVGLSPVEVAALATPVAA